MGLIEKIKALFTNEKVDYTTLIKNGAVIIDVRTEKEFRGGNIKGSINYPMQNIHTKIEKLKTKQVILVCKSGTRARIVKRKLIKAGIEAYNAGAWHNL